MHRSFKACIQPNKEIKEREKVHQQKLGELTTHIQRLEHCMALLRADNQTLRKRHTSQRQVEEKTRSHNQQNSVLAPNARKREEKIQPLYQENTKAKHNSIPKCEVNPEVEHLKRTFAQQRARDLSRYTKDMQAKDKEIDNLRKKYQELANKFCSNDKRISQSTAQFEEKEEFVHIIKTAAKERLHLEYQLAYHRTNEISLTRSSLEQDFDKSNYNNEREVTDEHVSQVKLQQTFSKTENLDQQLKEKSKECTSLAKEHSETKYRAEQTENKLSCALSDIRQLTCKIRDLEGKVKNTDKFLKNSNCPLDCKEYDEFTLQFHDVDSHVVIQLPARKSATVMIQAPLKTVYTQW